MTGVLDLRNTLADWLGLGKETPRLGLATNIVVCVEITTLWKRIAFTGLKKTKN